MPLVVKDRVMETTTTTGTGTITLAGAVSGYQSFSAVGNANTTYYAIFAGSEWEVGIGTYTASGTTLSRDTVLESSNSGSKVNFSAGSKTVICTYPAEKSVYLDANNNLSVSTSDVQEFTSSGTWTKPSNAKFVMVEAIGAGGGGGSGRIGLTSSVRTGGGGGGGGAYGYGLFPASSLPSSILVTVGAGGTGGASRTATSVDGASGVAGGSSSFGSFLTVYGGNPGNAGTAAQVAPSFGGGVLDAGGVPGISGGISSLNAQGAFGSGQQYTGAVESGFGVPSGFGGGGGGGTDGATVANTRPGGSSFRGGGGGGSGGAINGSNAELTASRGGGITGTNATGGFIGIYGSKGNGFAQRIGGGGGRIKQTVSTLAFASLAYGNSRFAAASTTGLFCVSTDNGATWSLQASTNIVNVSRLYYFNSMWIVVNSPYLWTSTDLLSWTEYEVGSFNAVGFYNGLYVIVGNSGSISTSTDLITWTPRTSGTTQALNDVTHDGTRWIVVGNSGVSLTSTDGITWTLVTTASSGNWSRIASSGSTLVATTSTTPFAWRSTNGGSSWSAVSTTLATGGQVIYAGSQFLLTSTSSLWTSSDGNTWTLQTDGTTDTYSNFAYSGTAYATASNSATSNAAIVSSDGVTWSTKTFASVTYPATAGGDGGIGAGGGGGAAALNGDTGGSGAGGKGGDGMVRIYTW